MEDGDNTSLAPSNETELLKTQKLGRIHLAVDGEYKVIFEPT